MSNVVRFPGITRFDLDPDLILQEAMGKLEGVVITGYDKHGNTYFASSYSDGGNAMWLLEICKKALLDAVP
jgi:hypothetical protein